MEGNEIIKHTKKAYSVLKSGEGNWKHKAREILIEVLIIIFAVSTSIWLSNWSESAHDRKEAREFLSGYRKDLQLNIENIKRSKDFYKLSLNGINYFMQLKSGKEIARDSLNKYSGIFFSSTDMDPNIGRYEGLKSSGKFKIIENKELLNNIIELQETIIQRIQYLNRHYQEHNEKLENIIFQRIEVNQKGQIENPDILLQKSDFRLLMGMSIGLLQNYMIPIHETGIDKCNEIISLIDKELK